jgi:hypothetical protein
MTRRKDSSPRVAAILLAACGCLVAASGCDPRSLAYFLQPGEPMVAGPEETHDKLVGKKVVIVCSATAAALGEFPSLERDVTREVAGILRKKIKKISIVDPDKVVTWLEAHPKWSDPSEAAHDFEADAVIFLEIEQFQLQSPGDLNVLHGESKTHIQVFELRYPTNSKGKPITDQRKEAHNIYDQYAESTFPNRGPIPIDSGSSRGAFKNTFLRIVAKEISWHFVDHAFDEAIQNSRIEK